MKTYPNSISLFGLSLFIATACQLDGPSQADVEHKSAQHSFPRGEKVTNNNFTGEVWLNYLVETDSIHNVNIGAVTFAPGARTNWHYHQGGQILLVTEGRGLYQEKGKPITVIEKGAVVKCPPDIEHWHGATASNSMTHIAIGTNTNVGGAIWLAPVTDEEYRQHEL